MKFETIQILSAMTDVPNRQDVEAALAALTGGATVAVSPSGVDPSELARTWESRRGGPSLPPGKHKVVDALLAELWTAGTAPWVLRSIRTKTESFIVFVDSRGVGRACVRMT